MIPIANFEQKYKIDNQGNILNLATNLFLKPIQNNNGYLKVGLALGNGQHLQQSVHKLVALHFLPNPYQYNQINHIDGNKLNNHFLNLEWCTSKHNINHALKNNLRKGYMSANDKEKYLSQVLNGTQVKNIALKISRHPNTLHRMLRETAKRLGLFENWKNVMKKNRKNAAIKNLQKINSI